MRSVCDGFFASWTCPTISPSASAEKFTVPSTTWLTSCARRANEGHDGHRATQRSPTRRQLGVNPASGCAQGAHETPELVSGRASAAHSPADTLPLVPVGRRWSAARVPASNRARATQVYSLEGCGHIIGTGPGSHLGPCAARTGARDSRVSVVSIGGGHSTKCSHGGSEQLQRAPSIGTADGVGDKIDPHVRVRSFHTYSFNVRVLYHQY